MPFAVTVPYRPRPDLYRLGSIVHGRSEARPLDVDRTLPEALGAKWARLRALSHRCVALAPDLADAAPATWAWVCRSVAALVDVEEGWRRARPVAGAAAPALLQRIGDEFHACAAGWAMPADPARPFRLRALRPDAVPVLEWIAGRPAAERPLHALALAVQEDLAWVEAPAPGTPVRAALLHVCWPSGWDPAQKAGLDFAAIHRPVADGAALRAASAALSQAIVARGPFLRFVWTVSPSGERSRHPADEADEADEAGEAGEAAGAPRSIDDLWFRCERQVTLPVPGPAAGALFLIRVHVAPLAEVAGDAVRRGLLVAALDSMSPATLAYKRLDGIAALLR